MGEEFFLGKGKSVANVKDLEIPVLDGVYRYAFLRVPNVSPLNSESTQPLVPQLPEVFSRVPTRAQTTENWLVQHSDGRW